MNEDKAQQFYYYWNLFGSKEIDRPTPEFEFDKTIGRKHRFDWAWPQYRIAVEVDGGQWSCRGGRHAGDADREKLNIAASLRWLVFRFSPDQLKKEPERCVNMVLTALMDSL